MRKLLAKMKNRNWNYSEICLSLLAAFLSGIVVGSLLSPKGSRYYGCFNGNNSPQDAEDESDQPLE